jgi:hypothetical protein
MAMSKTEEQIQQTQHAFLVAWGQFAQETGLIKRLASVKLRQKTCQHRPQTKVMEFLVAILSGFKQLQDISRASHPLDKDQAVAEAWGEGGWADYSGVSRTMSSLSWEEVHSIVKELDEFSQPFLAAELEILNKQEKRLTLDGDLTGIPVSNTSTSYPNAAYGHMDNDLQLGYQAGVVSLVSETYGRLWLAGTHHPGDTVSSTQAESLVLKAEARIGLRPLRRTDLLEKRIADYAPILESVQERLEKQRENAETAQERLNQAQIQLDEQNTELEIAEQIYQVHQRIERPTSRLALLRQRSLAAKQRCVSRKKAVQVAKDKLAKTQVRVRGLLDEISGLRQRLKHFQEENLTNQQPIDAEFRLDAGFGSYANIALLIEMGYEVYTKPHGNKTAQSLRNKVEETSNLTRVGTNAEMLAWENLKPKGCAYPLDVALERFYTGRTLKHSALCHFGTDKVTQNLSAWFKHYNGRQIIEAGIKETKQVFYLHRIKVRSEPAIFLQEQMALFAANFIRWATLWLAEQVQPHENALNIQKMGIKHQVQVGAHVSAQVIRSSEGMLLKFSEHSAFAGKVLALPKAPLPSGKRSGKAKRFFDVLHRFLPNRI